MHHKKEIDHIFLPILTKREQDKENSGLKKIIEEYPDAIIIDQFSSQKKELFKIQNPKNRLSANDLDTFYNDWKKDKDIDNEGIWVFYPWSKRLIHILDKQEFIQLRTSRNQYKISPKEQADLLDKRIGIIGLSVGHSVAISIATERICGKLKLADFDTIELSNLNRLKTGIHNIGLNKCIVTAREISEIDPFLDIECFTEGITNENLPGFLLDGGKLDILIDECDDLEIKISCREIAKKLEIPVVMETSDRGMLDVERFDLEGDRTILHGLLEGFPSERLKNIAPQDRLALLLRIIDAPKASQRGRVSLLEVGQTIGTWPQLASAVTLGGGVVTDVSRRILLNQFTDSGRYYVDLESIVGNKSKPLNSTTFVNSNPVFDTLAAIRFADSIAYEETVIIPEEDSIRQIVEAGSLAPSSGNDQPWKWLYRNGRLHLFHNSYRSFSFANPDNIAANLALGAAYENVILKSNQLGFRIKGKLFPLSPESGLSAAISFIPEEAPDWENIYAPDLVDFISSRSTNRNKGLPTVIEDSDYISLREAAESVTGAKIHYITDGNRITDMGKIIGECDLISLLNNHGHQDFYERDTKWTAIESETSNDGISVQALGNGPAQLAALSLIRDEKIAETLQKIGGGNSLVEATQNLVSSSSCLAILTMPESTSQNHFLAGMALQRMWLRAEQLGFAVQPFFSPVFLFSRLKSGSGLKDDEIEKLINLRKRFRTITNLEENLKETLILKICRAEKQPTSTKRLPLNDILFMINDKV